MFWLIIAIMEFLLIVLFAEAVREILGSLGRLVDLVNNANPGAFKNGNTDPTGQIDEGDYYAFCAIREAEALLIRWKKEGPWLPNQ